MLHPNVLGGESYILSCNYYLSMPYQLDTSDFWRRVEIIRQKDQIYRKYATSARWGLIICAVLTGLGIVGGDYLPVAWKDFLFGSFLGQWIVFIPVVAGFAYWSYRMQSAWECELTADEKLALRVSSILWDMKRYSESQLQAYRNEAAKNAKSLASDLSDEWNRTDLLKGIYGRHFEKLSTYLEEELVPALRQRNTIQLDSGFTVLYSFCGYLMDSRATLGYLDSLNLREMKVTSEQAPFDRLVKFFAAHPALRLLCISVVGGVISGILVFYLLGVSKDTATNIGGIVFAAIVTCLSISAQRIEPRESSPPAKRTLLGDSVEHRLESHSSLNPST